MGGVHKSKVPLLFKPTRKLKNSRTWISSKRYLDCREIKQLKKITFPERSTKGGGGEGAAKRNIISPTSNRIDLDCLFTTISAHTAQES